MLKVIPSRAPKKRLRGKGRYFRKVQRTAAQFEIHCPPGTWWDFWHYHADWPGWGNLSWMHRLEHIRALCTVFRKIAFASEQFEGAFQTWIMLDGDDAGQDATYLHTPNPNGETFPLRLTDVQPGDAHLRKVFDQLLPEFRLHVVAQKAPDKGAGLSKPQVTYWIWATGIGLPLIGSDPGRG